jgi:hypothetical protein
MTRKRRSEPTAIAQQNLFQTPSLVPVVPREVLDEILAALADLLLDATRPSETEVADER